MKLQVAILCNHQRAVPKGHADQMQRLEDKLHTAKVELEDLELELKVVRGEAKASKLQDPSKKLSNQAVYGPSQHCLLAWTQGKP